VLNRIEALPQQAMRQWQHLQQRNTPQRQQWDHDWAPAFAVRCVSVLTQSMQIARLLASTLLLSAVNIVQQPTLGQQGRQQRKQQQQ
jgi:hypothetical protein